MPKILLLVPPNKKEFIRDTYYGCWHEKKFLNYSWPPLTLHYLNAILQKDHEVHVLDGSFYTEQETLQKIYEFKPEFLVFSTGTFTFNDDIGFLEKINPKPKIIAFGQHATVCSEEVLKKVDYIIRGEPEAALADILQGKQDIRGLCFGNTISDEKALVDELDSLPFPNLGIEESKKYSNPFALRNPTATVIATRGCPFDCIFCTVPGLYGKKFRKRSVGNVMSELIALKEKGFKEIFFRDENLTLNREFIHQLCNEMIEAKLRLSWMCNSRVDTIDKETLDLMKRAGCHLMKFGVESGSQEILDKINKGIKIKRIKAVFDYCNKIGVDTVAHFMLGNLGDSEQTINETIGFAKKLNPFYASFDIVLKYPGTRLCEMQTEDIHSAKLKELHDKAFKEFYMRPGLILRHIMRIRTFYEFKTKFYSTLMLWRALLKC